MNERSLLFLQALWDAGAEKEKIQQLNMKAFQMEFDTQLRGVLHPSTIWVSEETIKARGDILEIRQRLDARYSPAQTLPLLRRYQEALGRIQALQIRTAKSLTGEHGVRMREIHILVRQLHPIAHQKIRQLAAMQMFRVLALCGAETAWKHSLPKNDTLEGWLDFCKKEVQPLCDSLALASLDGRWAYERRTVRIAEALRVTQYVSSKPPKKEFRIPLGTTKLDTSEEGNRRICGRGYITNLRPADVFRVWGAPVERRLPDRGFLASIQSDSEDPKQLLDRCFHGQKYLVRPSAYFGLMNRFLLIREFKKRSDQGLCLFCGMPLYHGECRECGMKKS